MALAKGLLKFSNTPGHRLTKKPVRVHLAGGLGNQLFIYTFGMYYSVVTNRTVTFDLSAIPHGFTKRDLEITNLTLAGPFIKVAGFLPRLWLNGLSKRLSNVFPVIGTKNFESTAVGFDESLNFDASYVNIRGYFQCFTYLEALKQYGAWPEVNVTNPSAWFNKMLGEVSDPAAVAVHCRFGDFLALGDSFGVLGSDYFQAALDKAVRARGADESKIYVFSDDIDRARTLFQTIKCVVPVEFVSPPESSSAAESLVLMSKAGRIVIANSTYSWWAAALNKQSNKLVFAPSKWFRGLDDPNQLYPPDWINVESSWL